MTQTQPYGTVLIKADKILDFLSSAPTPQPLHAIAKATEMTNPTTLKILGTLELIGYVTKNDTDKTYVLGSGLVRYANQYLANLDISKIAYPYLKELHDKLDETVHLSIREGDEILYVNKLESMRPIVVTTSRIGYSKPMYASAMGKAILSELPEAEVDAYLERVELKPFTPHTLVTATTLKEELAEIREKELAFDNSEEQIEVFCMGATLSINGKNYGAFSVSMPTYRRTPEKEATVAESIRTARRGILKELQNVYMYI